jgi:hypothetical protein
VRTPFGRIRYGFQLGAPARRISQGATPAWLLVDLAAGSAMTVLLWVVVNETSALVFACLWAVLVVIGWLSRSRRKPNDHT